jgi:predicted nucleic acid-binding Zn ribbon protein
MNDKRINNKDFFKLGDFLTDVLAKYRISYDFFMLKAWDVWEDALGEFISAHTKPAVFKGGLLIVNVDNPAMMQQLHFLKKEVIAKLNKAMGKDVIKDIKFKAGADV